jgi:mono/diheme cytochrome c family protein
LPAPVRAAVAVRNWIGGITLRTLLRWTFGVAALVLLLVAALALATILYTDRGGGMLPRETVRTVIYADQGWGAGVESPDRQTFYYTPQGAVLKDMRYSWFVHLEMPWGKSRFADPDVLRRYGFLVDDQTPANPDRLPIGFTKHFDRQSNEEMLDVTCAACHTGQLNVTKNGRTTALRIDGGSGLHAFTDANFGHFVPTMVSSMVSTVANPLKFSRFARKVLGDDYPKGRFTLRLQLLQVIGKFAAMGWNEKVHGLSPTEEGYGRTDALARIANTVFGDHLEASNYAVGNAPVNYPPLWNIWKFDWVQYNASVSQPMARNIGEAMGTGAKYALLNRYGAPLPPEARFRSTAMIENLHTIELTLRKLQPPAWNEQVLGPIDRGKAARGKELFDTYCARCHGPFIAPPALKTRNSPLKSASEPEWIVRTVCVEDVGTDPNTALNFYDARVDLTPAGLTAGDLRRVARRALDQWKAREAVYLGKEIERLNAVRPLDAAAIASRQAALDGLDASIAQTLSQIDPTQVPVGSALSYLGTMIRDQAYADLRYTKAQQDEFDGFGTLDLPQVLPSYKPRPLAGIWASPPFLHNGSVPTIYDLLSPAADRPKTFHVGSREFDPVKIGLATAGDDFWRLDTSKDGNHNTGHQFTMDPKTWTPRTPPKAGVIGPLLSHDDKMAILEHLKVRNDDLDGPQEPREPPSYACNPPPPRPAKVIR